MLSHLLLLGKSKKFMATNYIEGSHRNGKIHILLACGYVLSSVYGEGLYICVTDKNFDFSENLYFRKDHLPI